MNLQRSPKYSAPEEGAEFYAVAVAVAAVAAVRRWRWQQRRW
jgi:hypothetical protein